MIFCRTADDFHLHKCVQKNMQENCKTSCRNIPRICMSLQNFLQKKRARNSTEKVCAQDLQDCVRNSMHKNLQKIFVHINCADHYAKNCARNSAEKSLAREFCRDFVQKNSTKSSRKIPCTVINSAELILLYPKKSGNTLLRY